MPLLGRRSKWGLCQSLKISLLLRGFFDLGIKSSIYGLLDMRKWAIRQFPLVIIKTTKSLGSYGTTESLGVHIELAKLANSILDINGLELMPQRI